MNDKEIIKILKAALIKERDRQLGCERLTVEQLARELPEIDWGDVNE